jgi:cytochrome c oxidase subunit 2
MVPLFSTFDPHSSLARPMTQLFVIVGIVMAVIFLLVTGLVLYASFQFRQRTGQGDPIQQFGRKGFEIAWTAGPILVLFFIFIATIHAMDQTDPLPAPGRQPDLVITAHQWWWEARYMDSHAVAANEIHIPVGRRLYVRLESADVIHDWWVPQLGRKVDAIPGHPNFLWLEADSAGTYEGTCAEYCGAEHAWMRILVVAEPEADFEQWTSRQLQAPPLPLTAEAQEGAKLFQQRTCSSCHSVASTPDGVDVGPNLAHIASRRTLAAGRIENTPANLISWLSNPQTLKPASHMPDFQLSDLQVRNLAAYLETLK